MGEAIITRRGGIFQEGAEGFADFPEFTYENGTYKMLKYGDGNWVISFLTSGTLNITKLGNMADGVDIFLVGGGGNGGDNTSWYDSSYGSGQHYTGGQGGGSAYTTTQKGVSLQATSYPITIAAAEGTTSGFGYTAAGGTGGTGKRNGGDGTSASSGYDGYAQAGHGQDGEYAFGESDFYHYTGKGYRFAASGGGGCGYGAGSSTYAYPGNGGKDGAGAGSKYNVAGTDAVANSGSGAGGCGGKPTDGSNTKGKGGSGIIIMRNAR